MTNKNISYKLEQGKRLKELRLYLRLTQDEFGEKIGLKWSQVKDRESGIVKISPSEAKIINHVYGISYEWLLTGHGSMTTGVSIGEQQLPYQPSITAPTAPDITTLPHLPPISITEDLLSKTANIIDSQTPFASALKSNIEAFSRGLSLERDLAAYRAMLNQHTTTIEHQNKIIEEQNIRLNTFEERLKSMEEKKAG